MRNADYGCMFRNPAGLWCWLIDTDTGVPLRFATKDEANQAGEANTREYLPEFGAACEYRAKKLRRKLSWF